MDKKQMVMWKEFLAEIRRVIDKAQKRFSDYEYEETKE